MKTNDHFGCSLEKTGRGLRVAAERRQVGKRIGIECGKAGGLTWRVVMLDGAEAADGVERESAELRG